MAEVWAMAVGAAGALGATYITAKAGAAAGGGGGGGQRNLGNELGQINEQYNNLLSQLTGGSGSFTTSGLGDVNALMRGNFNQDAANNANPGLLDQFYAAKQSGELNPGWTYEQYLKASGIDTGQYMQGGLGDVSQQLNTQNRNANLTDAQNLAPGYAKLMHDTNSSYYDQLNTFTQAANSPIQQGAAQQQAAQRASQGFGTFDPSGLYANTNFTSQTINPNSISSQTVMAPTSNPVLQALNQQALSQGTSDIQTKQNALANQLLDQGGNLSESELRNVQQSSRAGFAARGLDATNASVVDEVLNTDAAKRARLTQNLGLAQGIQNQGLAESNQHQQFGLGVSGQNFNYGNLGVQTGIANAGNNLSAQQANQSANLSAQTSNASNNLQTQNLGLQAQTANQNFGLGSFNANLQSQQMQQQALQQAAALQEQQRQSQLQAMLAATNAQQAGTIDPYAAMLSGTQNNLNSLLGLNQANQGNNMSLLQTLYGYGGDLNNTNYNANAAANIAAGNNNAALTGSLIGAGSQLGGAYLANRGAGGKITGAPVDGGGVGYAY